MLSPTVWTLEEYWDDAGSSVEVESIAGSCIVLLLGIDSILFIQEKSIAIDILDITFLEILLVGLEKWFVEYL